MRAILLVLFFCFPLTACFPEGAGITVGVVINDPYTWDFGSVKAGGVLKHDFVLKNDSAKALKIGEVNTSCGCTVSKVEKKVLGAQESTLIKVEFNTFGYNGLTQQFVYVNTDNLDKPVIRYIIKADVVK